MPTYHDTYLADLARKSRRTRRRVLDRMRSRATQSVRHPYQPHIERLESRLLMTVETEPNNSLATANAITAVDTVSGRLATLSDVDYFKLNLTEGSRFKIGEINYYDNEALSLPPAIEILDDTATLLGASNDGTPLEITANQASVIYVRVTSDSAFGPIATSYAFKTTVTAYSGAVEVEPNNTRGSATSVNTGLFRGSLSASDTADFYSVNLNANSAVYVNFNGAPAQRSGVRLWSPTGTLVSSASAGQGLAVNVDSGGLYTIEVLDNSAAGQTQNYVGVLQSSQKALFSTDLGDSFDQAFVVPEERDSTFIVGELSSLTDVDIYSISLTTLSQMFITLQLSGSTGIPTYGRQISVFDKQGAFVATTENDQLYLARNIGSTPGEYFLVINATSTAGLGTYGIQAWNLDDYSKQRDVPLHFLDFTKQFSDGYFKFLNPFVVPEAIPYITAFWRTRYSAYDIDWTLTRPNVAPDRWFYSGIGDFENLIGGSGGGGYNLRRPIGYSSNNHEEKSWNLENGAGVLVHEFGHMAGMWHVRDISSEMAYVHTDNVHVYGTQFRFLNVNQFRPASAMVNGRNWVDWNFGAGSQVPEQASDLANPQSIDGNLMEMSLEYNEPSQIYATGVTPTHQAVGDLNGDGWKDIIVSQFGTTLSVYMSDAKGGFLPARNYTVNPFQWWNESVTSADFNRDGRDDVAIISRDQETMTVMLASADGTLVPSPNQSIGRWPQVIQSVDMNGDGIVDLVAANANNQVTIMRGRGDGTFFPGQSTNTGLDPNHLVLMDFNGDGRTDIATSNHGSESVTVLLANFSGGYNSASVFPVGVASHGLTGGDYDGDGDIDLAAANHLLRTLTIYINRGDGQFDKGSAYDLSVLPENLTTADLNRDGLPDIIASGASRSIDVLLGMGGGTFTRSISFPVPSGGVHTVPIDVNRDGILDLATIAFWDNQLYVQTGLPDNPRNNRVVTYGNLDSSKDIDVYSLKVAAGSEFAFDIDAAEFQYPLDAELTLLSSSGEVLASNKQAIDRESGLDSVDPYIVHKFTTADTIRIVVASQFGTAGDYRLKVTPTTALKGVGPRVLGVVPENRSFVDSTQQIVFLMESALDATSFTSSAIVVRGAQSGIRSGSAQLDPLDNTLIWTADAPLPVDTYTVTLVSGSTGVRDLFGNALDGEIASDFKSTTVSGNGVSGGNYVSTFTVQRIDNSPANLTYAGYERDPSNRGRFMLRWDDSLLFKELEKAEFTLRGAGPDGQLDTADDRLQSLDAIYGKLVNAVWPGASIDVYTRGYPDNDLYRIEATLKDTSGNVVPVYKQINVGSTVPETALSTTAARTQVGLTGSYFNRNLTSVVAPSDWRATQTIAGTRIDNVVAFDTAGFGSRAAVGITGGTDADWDNFSVQWDGFITIPRNGMRLQMRNDDGSRLWVDFNKNGQFESTEYFDNGWGRGQWITDGALTPALATGTYAIRVQFENGSSGDNIHLEWIEPDTVSTLKGHINGPSVIGASIQPGSTYQGPYTNRLDVDFSGAIDLATLTPANLRLRYSPDPTFFDGNDTFVADADGVIAWNPVLHRATFQAATALKAGYYLIELNGSTGGIRNTAGVLLDGEFLTNYVAGNTNILSPSRQLSGNGLPGGDYRAAFSVAGALDLTLSSANVSENSGTTLATVTRNDAATGAITVTLTSSDATAVSVPTTVTIPAGASSATFVITIVNDALADGDQLARITAMSNGYVSTSADIKVIDDETPTFTVTVSPSSMPENGGTAQVTVSRNTLTTLPVVVALASSNIGAATLPSTVTIPAGAASATVLVSAVDDTLADGDETVTLTASQAGFTSGSAAVVVVDNETAMLLMTLSVASMAENGGRTVATVTRNTPTTSALTVNISSSDSRLVSLPATITLGVGASSSSFFVTAINDSFAYGSQTVSITASSSGFISAVSQVTIIDDDEAAFTVTLNAASMSENGGRVAATVLRNTPTTFDQVVNLTSSDPKAAGVPARVTIPAGSTSVSFDVVAVNDAVADGNQLTFIVASAPGMRDGQAQVTVTDDDLATLTLAVVSSSISERDGQTQVTVTRNTPPSTALRVNLSSNPAFKLSMPASVTIAAGALSTTFVVQAIDDTMASGNQAVTVTANTAGFIDGSAPITLVDDDLATLQLTLGAAFVTESVRTTTGRVTRNTPTDKELVVSLASSDNSAAIPAVTAVTIPAGAASVQFEIQVIDDTVADGTQLAIISAMAEGYVAGTATLNVMDDDVAALRLSATATRLSENGGTVVITVARNTPVATEQLITFQSNRTGTISFPPSVTIPAGAESTTIVVTGVDDMLAYGDRDESLIAAAAGLSGASLLLTVTDDDVAGLSLTFVSQSLAENGGVTSGRVQRNSPTSQALVVTLNASVSGVLSVPATITIPAGATFATFFVSAVDNLIAGGPRNVELVASATGLTGSTAQLSIMDDDVARLTLTLATGSVSENSGSISASVRRNTPIDEEQIVQLSSSAPTRVSLPASVTIPRGAESAPFQITIIDDLSFTGNVTAEIVASATGFVQATSTLLVIEDETNFPWHNALNPLDVNADGFISAFDALLVINHLNRGGSSRLPDPTSGNAPPPYLDVNRDGQSTAIDALLVINRLNQGAGAEGEDTSVAASADQLYADFEWLESLFHKRTNRGT